MAEKAEHAEAVKRLKKTVAFVNKKSGKIMQQGGLRPEFLDQIKDVLNSFVFKKPSERNVRRAQSLKKHIKSLRTGLLSKYDREFAEELLPVRLVESVDKLGVGSIDNMTVEEVDEINRDIQSLLHNNATKNRIILERLARNAADDLNTMMVESDNVVDKKQIEVDDKLEPKPETVLQKTIAVTGGRFNHGLETLIDTLDGGQFGILFKDIPQNFSDGRKIQADFLGEVDNFVNSEMEKAGITLDDLQELTPAFFRIFKGKKGQVFRKFASQFNITKEAKAHEATLGGQKFTLSMAEIMSIYMHAQAKFNLLSMMTSGIAVRSSVTNKFVEVKDLDISEIEAIDRLVRSNPKALRLTEIASETYENIYKPRINETSIGLKGIELAQEENYWHIQRFTRGGIAGTEAYRISLLESEGRLQTREGSGNPVQINGFFEQTLSDRHAISEYVGMARAYRAAKMLLNYRPWQKKIDAKGYESERRKVNTILERTEQTEKGSVDVVSGLMSPVIRGLVRSVLGNPVIMASQYVSTSGYFTETDFKYAKALKFLASNEEVERYRKNWSRYRVRVDGLVSSLALQELTKSDHALRVLAGKTDFINLITAGIHKVDILAVTEAGRITEAEMQDEILSGKAKKYWDREGINPVTLEFESAEYWDAFNKRADYFVRRTQPMFNGENKSVLTGSETSLARSFVLFRSYVDQPLRMFQRNQTALGNERITKSEYKQQVGVILGGLFSYTVLRHILDKILYRDDDDVSDLMLEVVMSPAKLLTFIGFPAIQLAKKTLDTARGKSTFFEPTFDTIATQFLTSILQNSNTIAEGIGFALKGDDDTFQSGPREGETKSTALIKEGMFGLFIDNLRLLGIPTRVGKKIWDGWIKDNEEAFEL